MNLITKLFAATVLLAGLNNAFADGRKEATIDLGKGAMKLTVSVPDFAQGPYDFAKNPGPKVNTNKKDGNGFVYGEVMYNAPVGESGVVIYEANAIQIFSKERKTKGALAESQALSMIKDSGFEGRATKIDCPPVKIEGALSVCYKMIGDKIFEGRTQEYKYAAILVSTSYANDTIGYTLMGTIVEKNVEKFNEDRARYENRALNSVGFMYQNSRVN